MKSLPLVQQGGERREDRDQRPGRGRSTWGADDAVPVVSVQVAVTRRLTAGEHQPGGSGAGACVSLRSCGGPESGHVFLMVSIRASACLDN